MRVDRSEEAPAGTTKLVVAARSVGSAVAKDIRVAIVVPDDIEIVAHDGAATFAGGTWAIDWLVKGQRIRELTLRAVVDRAGRVTATAMAPGDVNPDNDEDSAIVTPGPGLLLGRPAIIGTVCLDTDGDGRQQASEGVYHEPDVEVALYVDDGDGLLTPEELRDSRRLVHGGYRFTTLDQGTYTVTIDGPAEVTSAPRHTVTIDGPRDVEIVDFCVAAQPDEE